MIYGRWKEELWQLSVYKRGTESVFFLHKRKDKNDATSLMNNEVILLTPSDQTVCTLWLFVYNSLLPCLIQFDTGQ